MPTTKPISMPRATHATHSTSPTSRGMKVGELAKRTGLSVRALHYYDEIGLLQPSEVTESGHRLYGEAELVRLQQIKSLRQLGFSLDEIRACLDTPNSLRQRHRSPRQAAPRADRPTGAPCCLARDAVSELCLRRRRVDRRFRDAIEGITWSTGSSASRSSRRSRRGRATRTRSHSGRRSRVAGADCQGSRRDAGWHGTGKRTNATTRLALA